MSFGKRCRKQVVFMLLTLTGLLIGNACAAPVSQQGRIQGGDIKVLHGQTSYYQCIGACNSDTRCRSWTWYQKQVSPARQHGDCVLKGSAGDIDTSDDCCMSGLVKQKTGAGDSAVPGGWHSGSAPERNIPPDGSGNQRWPPGNKPEGGMPPAGSGRPGTRLNNVNFVGSDLYGKWNVDNPEVCVQACNGDPQCKAWTWVKPGQLLMIIRPNLLPGGFCALKNAIPPKSAQVRDGCCDSGY